MRRESLGAHEQFRLALNVAFKWHLALNVNSPEEVKLREKLHVIFFVSLYT